MKRNLLLGTLSVCALFAQAPPSYRVSTVAGGVDIPFPASDVTTGNLRLLEPQHTATDANGDTFLTDSYYNRILRITPDGAVTSFVGGDVLNSPEALAFGPSGDLYVCDTGNRRIRKIAPDGVITTIAGNGQPAATGDDGPALSAAIGNPWGIAVDGAGNVYFSDSTNSLVRRISAAGIITTVAGSVRGFAGDGGPATQARLQDPRGLALDATGNNLYIADSANHRIRLVSNGVIRTFAGNGNTGLSGDNGQATAATLTFPSDVKVGASGNVFIADRSNGVLRRVLVSGIIATIRPEIPITLPIGINFDNRNGLLLVDDLRRQLVRFELGTLAASVVISGVREGAQGDGGPATEAGFLEPWGIALDAEGNLLVADTRDSRLRRITPDGVIYTHAGNGLPEQTGDNALASVSAVGAPRGLYLDPAGNLLVSTAINGAYIRSMNPAGELSTIAGTRAFGFAGDGGPAREAVFFSIADMAYDPAGNLFLTDAQTHRVRRISPDGIVTTVAGSGVAGFQGDGGPAIAARLNVPSGIVIDPQGRVVFSDTANHRIRRLEPDGSIVTIAGTGVPGILGEEGPASEAQLNSPRALRYDAKGNLLISLPQRIRLITPEGKIYSIAGTVPGVTVAEDVALGTPIANAVSIAPAPDGSIYFVENGLRRVRKLTPVSE